MKYHIIKLLMVSCFLWFGMTTLSAATIYVDASASGANNGTSWTDAYTNFQDALDNASSYDYIWVAQGTYKPLEDHTGSTSPSDPRDKTFHYNNKRLFIYGGFNTSATSLSDADPDAYPTILSGDIGIANDNSDNCYHVLITKSSSYSIIDGFTIQGGNANGPSLSSITYSSNSFYRNQGGGIYLSQSHTTIQNCIFTNNQTSSRGAAIALTVPSSATVANYTVSNCRIYGNTGNCVYISINDPNISNCLIYNNSGSGLHTYASAPTVKNCIVWNNTGDGINFTSSDPFNVINCTIFGNGGYGIKVNHYSSTSVKNCIIRSNSSGDVWNGWNKSTIFSYTNAGGGFNFNASSNNNSNADPSFVDESDPDGPDDIIGTADDGIRISQVSPCLDAGTSSGAPSDDILGGSRPQENGYDMGAYEGSVFVCVEPSNMSASNLVHDNIDLSWTIGYSETAWNIEYKVGGDFSPGTSASGISTATANTNSNYNLSGLTAETEYYIYYQADCGSGDLSDWEGPFTVTTPPTCPVPSAMSEANIQPTSVDLSWTAGGTESSWEILWDDVSFSSSNPSGATTVTANTNSNFTLTGLPDDETIYYYYRADCSGGDYSEWVGPESFITPPSCPKPTSMSHFNIQPTSVDLSWTAGGTESSWEILWNNASFSSSNPSGATTVIASTNSGFTLTGLPDDETIYYYYRADCGGGDYSDWSNSYSFTTPPSCPKPSNMSSTNITATSADLSWTVGGSETSWEIMWKVGYFSSSNTTGTTTVSANTNSSFSLTGLTPNSTIYFYYRANCGGGDYSDWSNHQYLITPPTCPAPSSISLDSTSHETAIVSWALGGTETQWNIQWKAGYFIPGTGTEDGNTVATANTNVAITGLNPITDYYLYYQADCGGGDESTWAGPLTFRTNGIGDGTASVGLEVIAGLIGGFNTSGVNMIELNGKLVFLTTQGLYEYDGNSLNQILDSTGTAITSINSPTVVNGELFYSKYLGYPTYQYSVYRYDGTSISEIQSVNGSNVNATQFTVFDNTIYTSYTDYSSFPYTSYFLKYNGTYFEVVPNVAISGSFAAYNGAFYYVKTSSYPYKLYKNVNGTETELQVGGVSFGDYSATFYEYNGKLIVAGNSKTWETDGTTTTELKYGASTLSSAKSFTEVGSNLIFTANIGYSSSLCIYDGSSITTVSTANNFSISSANNLTEIDGVVYFSANSSTYGTEWFKYENGIATMLVDAYSGYSSGVPTSSTSGNIIHGYNGSVFFQATNGSNGYELWKYNGTQAYMVQDIEAGSGSSSPADMILYNDSLFFTASSSATGRELFTYIEIPDSALITFSDPIACLNDSTLQVPITIDNITSDLGAISLVFDYDTTYMTYDTLSSGHTNLNITPSTNFYINDYGGKMFISWASTNFATVENGDTLFTLQFLPKNAATFTNVSSTVLTWDQSNIENCEISDGAMEILSAIYTDSLGKVKALPAADLVNDLTNNTICAAENAIFTASGGATYQFFVNGNAETTPSENNQYSSAILTDNDIISVFVIDEDGCSSSAADTLVVRALPNITLINDNIDDRICAGDTVNFTATGASEYTFFLNSNEIQAQGTDSTYFIIPNNGDTITVAGINTNTGCENTGDSTYTLLLDGCYGTDGLIVYKNSSETPMGNVTAILTSGVDTVSVLTEANTGTFNFTKLYDNETYTFSATTGKTHGGINSTDALGIIQHTLNISPYTGLELKAADVDGIGNVNATDALLVMQRFVQSINSFGAGDWVFEDKSYTMTTDFTNEKVYSLAMGDVNGSYVPNTSESPSVFLASSGDIKVNSGQNITLPVKLTDVANVGAVSIAFYFPSHLMTINHIELANGGNVLYNIQGDELRIAWADGSTLNLAAGDVLFNIDATIIDNSDLANYPISILNVSEIANDIATPFSNITLEMPTFGTTTGINGLETATIPVRNFPNPFSASTTIEYTLPATSDVTLVIRNVTGSEIRTVVNATQAAGTHQVRIGGDDLATGTYFYTITVQEANRSYTVTKRMVVMK